MRTQFTIFFVFAIICLTDSAISQIPFIKRTIDPQSNRVTGIYYGDLDRDGDEDLVTCNRLNNAVVIWRNDGGYPIHWTKGFIDSNFFEPIYIYVNDIDNDSFPDIAASSAGGGKIAWWRNDGGNLINWTRQIIDSNFTSAHGISIADLNNDNHMDIIGSSAGLHQIAWWENNGQYPVTWSKHVVAESFHSTQTVMAVDIDGNQHCDILAGSSDDDQIAWWKNGGGDTIQWTKYVIANSFDLAHWVYACDMDNDLDMDVLGAAYIGAEIAWWRNNGGDSITWTKQSIGTGFSGAVTVHAMDFDKDLDMDVIGTAWPLDDIAWWKNNGDSSVPWTKYTIDANFNGAWPIIGVDIDHDGDNDIIAGADVLTGPGTSASLTWWENPLIPIKINENPNPIIRDFELYPNYPNPFNPVTTIQYELQQSSLVGLNIYNLLGQKIRTLYNQAQSAGKHDVIWNGKNDEGIPVSSGVYLYRLECNHSSLTKKLILLK